MSEQDVCTHVIPYMHPNAGGPPVVVDRLCRELNSRGWLSRVVTTDAYAKRDNDDWLLPLRQNYEVEVFPTFGPQSFAYSSALRRNLPRIVQSSRIVHVHGLWTYPTHLAIRECQRQKVPCIVMPHGMLDPNSLGRKRFKKFLYGRIWEWPALRQTDALLYTHAEERELAQASVRGLPEGFVMPLGCDPPPGDERSVLREDFYAAFPELRGRRLVLFLSRLHPKKGLDLLLDAFSTVARSVPDAHLVLVGPGSQSYVASLRRTIEQLGLASRVTFTGPLSGRLKWAAYAAAEQFVLPSYQENFALVAVEALSMGLPVILSRRVNIWKDLVSSGAVRICDLTPGSLAKCIDETLRDSEMLEHASKYGGRFVSSLFNWAASTDNLLATYSSVLSRQAQPNRYNVHRT